jgi:phosphoenolpyruvate---glycerone phosphotransferase subunit DhaL
MTTLTSAALAAGIARMHANVGSLRDELNAADRELGDGDTGMTIADLVSAWHAAAAELPPDVGPALVALARATRRASGSSLAAVLAFGIGAAGKQAGTAHALDRSALAAALNAATAAIRERSGANSGDKSILDSLLAVGAVLESSGDDRPIAAAAVDAAKSALDDFRDREAKLGRARIFATKSVGRDDPGMLAAWRLLAIAAGK